MLVHQERTLTAEAAIEIVVHFLLERETNLQLRLDLFFVIRVSLVEKLSVKAENATLCKLAVECLQSLSGERTSQHVLRQGNAVENFRYSLTRSLRVDPQN